MTISCAKLVANQLSIICDNTEDHEELILHQIIKNDELLDFDRLNIDTKVTPEQAAEMLSTVPLLAKDLLITSSGRYLFFKSRV